MEKKRKKSTAHRVPPLSKLDKTIYTVVSVLLVIAVLGAIVGWIILHRRIAFADPAVIACRVKLSSLSVIPLFLFVSLVGWIVLAECFAGHHPLFGDKTIRYGDYPWKTDIFPLFGPQHRPVQRRPSAQQFRSRMIQILAGIFTVTLLLAGLGIYGRICLREDRTIVEYSSFNRPGEPVSIPRDCNCLTVLAQYTGGRAPSWTYGVVIYPASGGNYEFLAKDFDLRRRGHTAALQQLLAIKALFSADQITIEGTERLYDVIEDEDLTEFEAKLLETLFSPPC